MKMSSITFLQWHWFSFLNGQLMWLGASPWLSSKESAYCAGDAGDVGPIPALGRSPGGGNRNPPQYSCWENPMDRGACELRSIIGHKKSGTTERLSRCRMWLDSNCKQDIDCSSSSSNPNSLFLCVWGGGLFLSRLFWILSCTVMIHSLSMM